MPPNDDAPQRDAVLKLVNERRRIAQLDAGDEKEAALQAWYGALGKWTQEHIGPYLGHADYCNAYYLNSKECNCGAREMLRSLRSEGAWAPGMDYDEPS